MLEIESIHHVSLPVCNLEESKRFYAEILGLEEIARPAFDFPGAWYAVGDRAAGRQLHLILDNGATKNPTFRAGKAVDSRDVHFAIRVRSYKQALAHLAARGYRADAADETRQLRVNPRGPAGFPQVYLLDPDRHVIEINAAHLDTE